MYPIKRKIIKITDSQYDELLLNEIKKETHPSLIVDNQRWNPIQKDLIRLCNGEINEGYYKTYPLDTVVHYIDCMLGERGVVTVNKRGKAAIINVQLINNTTTIEQLEKCFGLCGYYKSNEHLLNNGMIILDFEPRYPDDVTHYVNDIGILFHLTPSKHIQKILKNGLSPRSTNDYFIYPPRVYLLMGNSSDEFIYSCVKMLANGATTNGNPKMDIETDWSILGINVENLKNNVKFYGDTSFFNGYSVFTYDNIPPTAIKIVDTVKLFKRK